MWNPLVNAAKHYAYDADANRDPGNADWKFQSGYITVIY